ncbi:hypothetical protein Lal_00026958 [Lupinus albus]|nr:hypothetical protein Lal_00026958 [Lupinus albus]
MNLLIPCRCDVFVDGPPERQNLKEEANILQQTIAVEYGYEPLISMGELHQLHIFIFLLAVFHVIYSAITMTLGRAKSHLVDEDALNGTSTSYD